MGWTDFLGGLNTNPWVTGAASGGVDSLLGGTFSNPGSDIPGLLGFQNPNSSGAGKALSGDKGLWSGVSTDANRIFGTDVTAPQAQAPTWQKSTVTEADLAQMKAAQMQAAQTQAAQMQAANINTAQSDQSRVGQEQLIGGLQQTAAGQGPSIAQEQLRQSTAANINQQTAIAQSAHGAGRLAALRNAQMTGAATQQGANAQASALRAQEIATAQSQLGNALSTERGQDVTAAQAQASLQQQAALANSGYVQGANQLDAQMQQQAGLSNATFGQQANLANMQGANTLSQYNAGAANESSLQYAGAKNTGNLALAQANLGANLQTNALNTQRGNYLLGAELGAAGGQTGIDTTMYQGAADYNKQKQQMVGQGLNSVGQALPMLGSLL